MRIGIDLDNVTYPFVEQLQPIAEHYLQRTLLPPIQWNFYRTWNLTHEQFNNLMYFGWSECRLWAIGTPIVGAREVLDWLQAEGHELVGVTHRPTYAYSTTNEWVAHWGLPFEEVIFADDKSEHGLDIMLDDAPHVYAQVGHTKSVVFHRPWNAPEISPGMRIATRVRTWQAFHSLVRGRADGV